MNLVDVVMRDKIHNRSNARIELIRLPASVKTVGTRAVDSCGKLKKILYCNKIETAKVQIANEDPTVITRSGSSMITRHPQASFWAIR